MVRVERVPHRRTLEALRFVAGSSRIARGAAGGGAFAETGRAAVETQARHYLSLVESIPGAELWWALDGVCVAAALIVAHPGRVGFLFVPPAEAGGVDGRALSAVVREATRRALAGGLHFVQIAMTADGPASRQAAAEWGYSFVAELIYMSLDLDEHVPDQRQAATSEPDPRKLGTFPGLRGEDLGPSLVSWRRYGQFSEEELGELVLATYRDSRDCPPLLGLRPGRDVIASHRAGGTFHPESWWIADVAGRPAGCVLVNDRPADAAAEVEYLGVRPEYRGKGLAGELLSRAVADAGNMGRGRLILAVDSGNAPARRLYERRGFRPTHRRWIHAAIRGC